MTHVFKDCTIDLRGAGYACVSRGDEFEIGHTGEGDRVLIEGDTLDFTGLLILGPVALADRIKAAVALECYAMATERDALMAEIARLTAERDSATRAKDCFQRMTRAHWEALCAMRNSINEYIPMPNTDSGPLFSPEDGPIYADIAERVIADLTESRAYALALEQELRDRAKKAEAERDAALAGAVKVKPLVWGNFDAWTYWAKCAFGTYRAQERNGVWKATLQRRGDNTELTYEYTTDGLTPGDFEAAKAAAQADYDARILAAIQPEPEARQADLAKAWMMGRDDANDAAQSYAPLESLADSELSDLGRHARQMWRYQDARIRALTPPADLAAKIGGE